VRKHCWKSSINKWLCWSKRKAYIWHCKRI